MDSLGDHLSSSLSTDLSIEIENIMKTVQNKSSPQKNQEPEIEKVSRLETQIKNLESKLETLICLGRSELKYEQDVSSKSLSIKLQGVFNELDQLKSEMLNFSLPDEKDDMVPKDPVDPRVKEFIRKEVSRQLDLYKSQYITPLLIETSRQLESRILSSCQKLVDSRLEQQFDKHEKLTNRHHRGDTPAMKSVRWNPRSASPSRSDSSRDSDQILQELREKIEEKAARLREPKNVHSHLNQPSRSLTSSTISSLKKKKAFY